MDMLVLRKMDKIAYRLADELERAAFYCGGIRIGAEWFAIGIARPERHRALNHKMVRMPLRCEGAR
jgi:hypothetical protein